MKLTNPQTGDTVNKPLRDVTLREMQRMCASLMSCNLCCLCPFSDEDEDCRFYHLEPERWRLDETALTDREIAVCRGLGATYVTRNYDPYNNEYVHLWSARPKLEDGFYTQTGGVYLLATVYDGGPHSPFRSTVRPGDCVCVEEATPDV